jgi:apoptosis-inducing factor 3
MDALPRFATRIARGRVLVSVPATPSGEPPRTSDSRCFVIVGAGAAGAAAAQTLREAGFGGRILMLDRENRVPYDRTILSKYVLSGQSGERSRRCRRRSGIGGMPSSGARQML